MAAKMSGMTLTTAEQPQTRHLSDKDLDALRVAQQTACELCWNIIGRLETGMSEADAYAIARAVFKQHGLHRHWHQPYIGLGPGTTKLRSTLALLSSPLHRGRRLLQDDLVMVDIAPEVDGIPSDYTVTCVVGVHPARQQLCSFAREVARALVQKLADGADAVTLVRHAKQLVAARPGCELGDVPVIHLGHRLERTPAYWPRLPESPLAYLLLDRRLTFLNGRDALPVRGMWVIEPYVLQDGRAAKHEELVFVNDAGGVSTLNPPAPSQ